MCYPYGTDEENSCNSINQWQWQHPTHPDQHRRFHAPGVNPSPAHRITANGNDSQKIVWAYTGDIKEGEAMQIYNPAGQPTVDMVLNTPINHITFIANIDVETPSEWFKPGKNNTGGCGQKQTNDLPFGFKANSTDSNTEFKSNLQKLHQSGMTITLTLASWCTQLPVTTAEEWEPEKFEEFVDYFKTLRQDTFGGYLDGVDFDWEGFCSLTCLKGHDDCHCGWSDLHCGKKSPEELAGGVKYQVDGQVMMCYMMPTKSTIQVMTGITKHMKDAGFVVTLVPMSTSMYSGEEDKTDKQVMRNEYVKYRKQPYEGGKAIVSGTSNDAQQFDLLDLADHIMLQWYSGYDAALCQNSDDPMACMCDNQPADGYPNVINTTNTVGGLITSWYDTNTGSGNMFPSQYPVRCQACGKNVTRPDGTKGEYKCAGTKGEDWFVPDMKTDPKTGQAVPLNAAEHNTKMVEYSKQHNDSVPHWWVKDLEVNSKCPRGIDCPDWRYKDEKPYSRQLKLLQSLSKVVDLSKITIGFETLGIDVMVQMGSYEDKALPYDVVDWRKGGEYWKKCKQNLTKADVMAGALTKGGELDRCAQPLLSQQWGLQFNATEVIGLEKAVEESTGKKLAGIGVYTLDGIVATDPEKKGSEMSVTECRYWYPELMKLNKEYKLELGCEGDSCWKPTCGTGPAPAPGPGPSPSGDKYSCDWSTGSPTCKRDDKYGWGTKEQCAVSCKKAPSGSGKCKNCFAGSSGDCMHKEDHSCYPKGADGKCPGKTTECGSAPGPSPSPGTPSPTPSGSDPSPHMIPAMGIAQVWKQNGGSSDTCQVAVAVALAESAGDCHATLHNTAKDDDEIVNTEDRGLWQLNSKFHSEVSGECAYSCKCNAKETIRISKGGTDFSTWTTFKKGLHKKYMSQALSACYAA
jgi:hypothetical protein